jgi:hypothetical protein
MRSSVTSVRHVAKICVKGEEIISLALTLTQASKSEGERVMQRTLRQWKELWLKWDVNNDIEGVFEEEALEDEDWDTLCEVQITLTTRKGNISTVLIGIIDPKTDEILVEYEYSNLFYELGRPEFTALIKSINDDDTDEEP